ncbi:MULTISPECIES: hypothetical protein [unclassified Beijerinckia]|uniref:hypothetical protein n=1 Tax=unclassified Beijerinckia TaxID=2638183 RepID=UPI00089D71E3|nr:MULTISPECIES: hypothetical protein [unclassified Beijerinckia]MDH7794532.1 hypothetical protein [Beijerinckia sp. GAS462]SEB65593.1 hypothetical protein SAMN05443249_0803 [Beijerinckia sp. 28-YEA-48]
MAQSSDQKPVVSKGAATGAVDAFLDQVNRLPAAHAGADRGRLVFALDATMSRQPTWDLALSLQSQMFQTASSLGGLDVQLLYFRGLAECRASRFIANGVGLAELMTKISVAGGNTQIAKVLRHVAEESRRKRVAALIYIGDAMEENPDELCQLAGEIGLLGVKAFMFHEGNDPAANATFREIARLTGGAYAHFDASAAHRLGEMLAAAAAYAAGGRKALEQIAGKGSQTAQALLRQMK